MRSREESLRVPSCCQKVFKDSITKALSLCMDLRNEFQKIFKQCDFILTPTVSIPPFSFNAYTNPVEMYQSDLFTIPANLCGLPAISFQSGFSGDLPLGMQLIGNHFEDHRLLNVVHHFQKIQIGI